MAACIQKFSCLMNRSRTGNLLRRLQSSNRTRAQQKWQLWSAVCLERHPIIIQPLTKMEARMQSLFSQIEFEGSLKSDHELRHEEDLVRADRLKKGDIDDADLDTSVIQTAQDVEDAGSEEFLKFQPGLCITDADKKNDRSSLNRKLNRSLFLVMQQKLGNDCRWVLPQGIWQEGENLRQTAERAFQCLCGDQVQAKFMGNAPVGFYKYKYPKSLYGDGKPIGAKVFFFKAQYKTGNITLNTEDAKSFQWLTSSELCERLQPPYWAVLSDFLLEDEDVDESNSDNKLRLQQGSNGSSQSAGLLNL